MWLHMCKEQLWVLYWPDMLHKFTRKAAMAIQFACEAKSSLKCLQRLFRCTRSPFNTSAHGKLLLSARKQLLAAPERGECDELLDMWFPGICRDHGMNVADFTVSMLIQHLKKRSGLGLISLVDFSMF